jgi:hypothetical protein
MKRKGAGSPAIPFSRISGFAALGFAALIMTSNLIAVPAGLPSTGADISDVTAFFGDRRREAAIASALTPAAWVLATVFGAGVCSVLWRSERDRGEAWSLVGLAGLLLQNATFAAVVATRLALASTTAQGPVATSTLWALHDGLFALNGTFLALALLGLSLAGRRGGLLRGWHGAWGLVAAGLLFASATLAPPAVDGAGPAALLGLAGWLMWVVWLAAYGITLLRVDPTA